MTFSRMLEAVADAAGDAVAELSEVVADKGYHSNPALTDLAELDVRSYVSERRKWGGQAR